MPEEPEAPSLGELFHAARIMLGLTVGDLAEEVGATCESIRHYESGSIPPPEMRGKIRIALGLKTRTINAAMGETTRRRKERKVSPKYIDTFRAGGDLLRAVGNCPCKNATLSSVDVLLLRCRAEKRNGNGPCKGCEVLKSKGTVLENGIKIVPMVARKL